MSCSFKLVVRICACAINKYACIFMFSLCEPGCVESAVSPLLCKDHYPSMTGCFICFRVSSLSNGVVTPGAPSGWCQLPLRSADGCVGLYADLPSEGSMRSTSAYSAGAQDSEIFSNLQGNLM